MRMNRRWDRMEKGKLNLREIAQTYEIHNRSEGKSLRTIYWYQQKIASFVSWMESQGCQPVLGNLRPEGVREFLLFLQAKNTRFDDNPFTSPKEGILTGGGEFCFGLFGNFNQRGQYTGGQYTARSTALKFHHKELRALSNLG